MKALLTSILLGAFAVAACAAETSSDQRTLVVYRAKSKTVTGSHISSKVKRIGNTYDTTQNVYVIDRQQIERSGGQTVGSVLRRIPFVRIR